MYSRNFSNRDVTLPPDYGGVAYKTGRAGEDRNAKEENLCTAATDADRHACSDSLKESSEVPKRDLRKNFRRKSRYGERPVYPPEECPPRRPLYSREGEYSQPPKPKSKSRLSSVLPFAGGNFRTEDVLLAGLLLLLLAEKEDGGKEDGELLLILAFLLFSK